MDFPPGFPPLFKKRVVFPPVLAVSGGGKRREILIMIIASVLKEGIDLALVTQTMKGYPFIMELCSMMKPLSARQRIQRSPLFEYILSQALV